MASLQTATEVLEQSFLEIRAKLLEIGASLDRIERAEDSSHLKNDPRLAQISRSIEILNEDGFDRAERIQQVFSDSYDPNWNS